MNGRDLKSKFQFEAGLRFELFFALQTLTDGKSRIHAAWKTAARADMPAEFWKLWKRLGESPELLAFISDTLRTQPLALSFEQLIREIHAQDIRSFQRELLAGELHNAELALKILQGDLTLKEAVARVPKAKQEWLAFTGLYPYQAQSPMVIALETLLKSPETFRKNVIRLLELFWLHSFKDTWQKTQTQLARSLDEKERLFQSCSLDEFSKQALLRIEVDQAHEIIKAVRGGFELPFKKIKAAFLIPSLFNDKRFWTCFEEDGLTTAYFPYFDPSISLDVRDPSAAKVSSPAPELDPSLIFKALADTTRYALISLIADTPKSAVELAKALSVSKPTISHHVHTLRDAGLIHETYQNGYVMLSLKREVFESLSQLTVNRLFHKGSPL